MRSEGKTCIGCGLKVAKVGRCLCKALGVTCVWYGLVLHSTNCQSNISVYILFSLLPHVFFLYLNNVSINQATTIVFVKLLLYLFK